jgi:hypothetical protein
VDSLAIRARSAQSFFTFVYMHVGMIPTFSV